MKKRSTKVHEARRLLSGAAPYEENFEDELALDNPSWTWIYTQQSSVESNNQQLKARIIGARRGRFQCKLGDALLLKASHDVSWVALLCGFSTNEKKAADGGDETLAHFMWLSAPDEIRNRNKRRTDALPVSRI